jgi:hypothetical protein
MKCQKCGKDFSDAIWKSGETYEGIDQHHNPPEFISDYLGEAWSGEFYNLCRKHHRELHDEILKILNKKSTALKFINSEYWICKRMNKNQIKEAQKEIYEFTLIWLNKGGENGTG